MAWHAWLGVCSSASSTSAKGASGHVIAGLRMRAGADLLDVHSDPGHNRVGSPSWARRRRAALTQEAVERLDLRRHDGVHPRIGVVDVVPFVALEGSRWRCLRGRDPFAAWVADAPGCPASPTARSGRFPEGRRAEPTTAKGHPIAGPSAVGARPVLVAYNLWLVESDVDTRP